jgi:hypothetical protein
VPAKSGLGFYARLARNLFSSLPFSVATHQSAELRAAAERLCRDDRPDLWHCEWTPYAEYLRRPLGQAPWVVMAHNVESLIWQRYVETESQPDRVVRATDLVQRVGELVPVVPLPHPFVNAPTVLHQQVPQLVAAPCLPRRAHRMAQGADGLRFARRHPTLEV